MSIIAWDGKILACDRQVCSNNMSWKGHGRKLFVINDSVYAWAGTRSTCLALIEWHKNGADPEKWPDFQKGDDWQLLVILERKTKEVFEYENIPLPVLNENVPDAWGSGCDYALGAMAMGADAIKAVEIASQFDPGCGFGVDWYDSETGKTNVKQQ